MRHVPKPIPTRNEMHVPKLHPGWGKRAFDLAAALAAIPLFLVCCVVLGLLNPVWNPGPIFFCQRRVGHGGQSFVIWKFRSMVGPAREARFEAEELHRLTPLGRFLRRSHLDELPQLINIIRGEMSVVGPRPEQESFARDYAREWSNYRLRHRVLPGITGRAQVFQGYATGRDEALVKLRHDLDYMADRHPFRDVGLLLLSLRLAVLGRSKTWCTPRRVGWRTHQCRHNRAQLAGLRHKVRLKSCTFTTTTLQSTAGVLRENSHPDTPP